jgi:hypothetical protein
MSCRKNLVVGLVGCTVTSKREIMKILITAPGFFDPIAFQGEANFRKPGGSIRQYLHLQVGIEAMLRENFKTPEERLDFLKRKDYSLGPLLSALFDMRGPILEPDETDDLAIATPEALKPWVPDQIWLIFRDDSLPVSDELKHLVPNYPHDSFGVISKRMELFAECVSLLFDKNIQVIERKPKDLSLNDWERCTYQCAVILQRFGPEKLHKLISEGEKLFPSSGIKTEDDKMLASTPVEDIDCRFLLGASKQAIRTALSTIATLLGSQVEQWYLVDEKVQQMAAGTQSPMSSVRKLEPGRLGFPEFVPKHVADELKDQIERTASEYEKRILNLEAQLKIQKSRTILQSQDGRTILSEVEQDDYYFGQLQTFYEDLPKNLKRPEVYRLLAVKAEQLKGEKRSPETIRDYFTQKKLIK